MFWVATRRREGRQVGTKLSATALRALRVVGDGFQMVVEPALRK